MEGHGRSWKVKESHGRSFPITRLTFQVRKVMCGGSGGWWVVACRICFRNWDLDLGLGYQKNNYYSLRESKIQTLFNLNIVID